MFSFEYSHAAYTCFLPDFAKALGVNIKNNTVIFPRHVGIGFMHLEVLSNGLQALIFDYSITQDFRLKKIENHEETYTLRFNDFTNSDKLVVKVDSDEMHHTSPVTAGAFLTSSLFETLYVASKGSRVIGVNILLTKEWLAGYLGITITEDVLQKYLSLKLASFNMEPLDAEYKRLMQEIMLQLNEEGPLKTMIIQNRMMLMVERFFLRLYDKMQQPYAELPLSKEDINRVMHVEAMLMKDIFQPAPTISQLAKTVSISETKLKKDFKLVYGNPIYEYFQKARMQTARELLLSGNYSIKHVARELGYINLSNFTIAFKKEFNILPSHVNKALHL